MTGIERLRDLAGGINLSSVWAVTHEEYDNAHGLDFEHRGGQLRDILADIADQIERETIPREPGDGDVGPETLHAMALSLLDDWERDAVAWVREHGGIAKVKEEWNHSRNLKRSLETAQAKVERQQRHIEFVQTKCRERQEHICELNKLKRAYVDALNGVCKRLGLTDGTGLPDMAEVIWTELDRRLMPEGMEWLLDVWPKWSNGEYCKFGDWWKADEYSERGPNRLIRLSIYTPEQLREWEQDEGENYGYEWNFMRPANTTYRPDKVEPPTPKVLDADGAEIRAGETLYHVGNNDSVVVRQLMPPDKFEDTEFVRHFVSEYTHRAPVLAADGRPLREGETVWHVKTGYEYTVREVTSNGAHLSKSHPSGKEKPGGHCAAEYLTHDRPDSWERLEEDIATGLMDTGETLRDCREEAKDLVRRAKRLAGEGE